MENQGWIKIHRKIQNKGWFSKSEYVHLWIYIILKANHKEAEFLFNNKIQKVERGQFITGRKSISVETGISESKVERILNCFETEQQIEQQKTNKFRLIKVIKYNAFQESEQQIEQQMNNNWTTSEQQVDTNKNDKKNKNEKKKHREFVFLSEEEFLKLKENIPAEEVDELIEQLNNYLGSTGKKYKSHYHTILTWQRKREKEQPKGNIKYPVFKN